jgi:hypothetical protein
MTPSDWTLGNATYDTLPDPREQAHERHERRRESYADYVAEKAEREADFGLFLSEPVDCGRLAWD